MNFYKKSADIFVPDSLEINEALERTTVMGISAHQDDIELMAYQGILECFKQEDKWFTGVTTANGANSPTGSVYSDYDDEKMQAARRLEQRKAAYLGEYSAQIQLNYSSSEIKDSQNENLINDYIKIFKSAKPEVVYTHNLADKHPTHLGVVVKVIQAIRKLDKDERPKKLYGCEVWRGLDWVNDEEKVVFDVSKQQNLANALISLYDSQICVGTRYDLSITGRRSANATYYSSHEVDNSTQLAYAMDLTPLIENDELSITDYICGYIDNFKNDVITKLNSVQ